MTLFDRLILRTFLPIFFLSLAFFVLIIQLMDLFTSLVRYLNLDVPFTDIVRVQLLFLPKAISFSLPIAVLFAAAFALGSLYSNNELIAVFGSGVPYRRFIASLIVLGTLLSIGLFAFEEYVVIDTYRRKNEESRRLLNIARSFSNTNVTVRSAGGRYIYSAEYYNDANRELSRVILLVRDDNGGFVERIDAASARWDETNGSWVLTDGSRFRKHDQTISPQQFDRYTDPDLSVPPSQFRSSGKTVEELRFDQAREWVLGLRDAGLEYRQPLTAYYSRFSFALTPLIVTLLATGLGGRFRKNVLLMSLFVSLVASVVYYVTGMVAEILAGDALIPPIVGAWVGVILFTGLGFGLINTTRT